MASFHYIELKNSVPCSSTTVRTTINRFIGIGLVYNTKFGFRGVYSYTVHTMPIYEFRCASCNRKVAIFYRSMTVDATGTCEHCGSTDLRRLFSSFRVMKPAFNANNLNKAELLDGVNYTDTRSMANFFNKMQDTFQDEPNEHMSEMVSRLEKGEAVESAMDLNMGSNYSGDDHAGHNHGPASSTTNGD